MAEKPLALVSYLVGESCLVSSISCFFKGPGPTGVLPLHADTAEVLERHANDERFHRLLGLDHPYGWASEGPDAAKMVRTPTGLYD